MSYVSLMGSYGLSVDQLGPNWLLAWGFLGPWDCQQCLFVHWCVGRASVWAAERLLGRVLTEWGHVALSGEPVLPPVLFWGLEVCW
jgi:hypothetical protein